MEVALEGDFGTTPSTPNSTVMRYLNTMNGPTDHGLKPPKLRVF